MISRDDGQLQELIGELGCCLSCGVEFDTEDRHDYCEACRAGWGEVCPNCGESWCCEDTHGPRCECPAPFEVRSNERWAVVCEWCGGLVRSDAERAER